MTNYKRQKGSVSIELTFVLIVTFTLLLGFKMAYEYYHTKYVLNNLTYNMAKVWAAQSKVPFSNVSDLETLTKIIYASNTANNLKANKNVKFVFTRCTYDPLRKVSIQCVDENQQAAQSTCHPHFKPNNLFPLRTKDTYKPLYLVTACFVNSAKLLPLSFNVTAAAGKY